MANARGQVLAEYVAMLACAVVLATPTAVVAAVAAAARLGIFIKNVAHLELASKITAFVFDKTGTLTDGLLSVVKLNPFGEVSPAELLKVAASAEQYSNHPTAVALQKLATEASLDLDSASDFHETPGKGVTAKINGIVCMVGRANWLAEQGVVLPDKHDADTEGMSVMYVVSNGRMLGWIGLKDKLRRESPAMIADLRRLGVRFIAMVTGDRKSVAESVAAQLQIDEYRSECLPEGKVEFVERIKESSRVAVVGDGGRSEIIATPRGEFFKTPASSTVVDLPAHSVVYPSVKDAIENMQTLPIIGRNDETNKPIVFRSEQLEMLNGRVDRLLKEVIFNMRLDREMQRYYYKKSRIVHPKIRKH